MSEEIVSGTENNTPNPQLAFFSTEENLANHNRRSEPRSSITSNNNPTRFSFTKEPRQSFLNMSRPLDKRFEEAQVSARNR